MAFMGLCYPDFKTCGLIKTNTLRPHSI